MEITQKNEQYYKYATRITDNFSRLNLVIEVKNLLYTESIPE